MTCLYGDPRRQTTILKRCDMQRDDVLVAEASHTAGGSSSGWIESRAQGGGPARSGELRARPTIRAAGMASEMKSPDSITTRSLSLRNRSIMPGV